MSCMTHSVWYVLHMSFLPYLPDFFFIIILCSAEDDNNWYDNATTHSTVKLVLKL